MSPSLRQMENKCDCIAYCSCRERDFLHKKHFQWHLALLMKDLLLKTFACCAVAVGTSEIWKYIFGC